ncbi:HAMP domain-containing histidine kinase [Eubacteriales bacterium OttesenSCG-928-K08]|nr:HAMP domain-containing histidine kinase [Eubacteriales bacterium OttesenSCG-928-K08]
MKRKIAGIKWKVFGYLLSFCLLLLIILTLFQTVFLDQFYIAVKQNQVEKQISLISAYVSDADWQSIKDATSGHSDILVEVWSLENGLILSSGNIPGGVRVETRPEMMDELFDRLWEEGGAMANQNSDKPGGGKRLRESLISTQLVSSSDGTTYAVVVNAILSPVGATVETLRVQLIYISFIMLLLAVGLSLLISRRISKPIVAISRTAGELKKGNYDVVFSGTGYKEVVQLADVLTETASELSKTESLRQELISNVSHDLRTPLTLIAGYVEMIRDIPEEANAQNMQVVIDETNRLSLLVSDLLDLSKLQAGTIEMNLEPFDIGRLAEEIVGRVARFCGPDGYVITYEPEENVFVTGDEERISQVIYNFILNAIAHTGEDKHVFVRLLVDKSTARLEVSDTGKGISAEELPYIWDRYYRGEKSHTRSVMGTGLGLSIVRSVLERHPNVSYGVESEPGNGSTFWFSMDIFKKLPEA